MPRPKRRKSAAASYPRVEVRSLRDLRAWFDNHHESSQGAWIVTFKKHVADRHVSAGSVAEEALCFGWIDSLPRALDTRRTMLLVTPRRATSGWSRLNQQRVAKLIEQGRMTRAGLAVIEQAKASGTWTALDQIERLELPADLRAAFAAAAAAARINFDRFPRSVVRGILEWIHNAKRPDTRARRIAETVALAADNVRANQWRR